LVTKQPTLKESYSGSVGVGSGDFKRVTADLNKPLDLEGGAAVRVNLVKDDSGIAGRDEVNSNKTGVAAAIAFGLKTDTRTYVNYLHMDQKNVPDSGVPTIGLPGNPLVGNGRVDSNNFYGTTSDFDNVKADMFTLRVEHDFSANVKLQNTTRYGKTTQEMLATSFRAPVLSGGTYIFPTQTVAGNLGRSSIGKDQENEIISNQTNITAKFSTGAVKHSLVGGFELTREEQKTLGVGGLGLLPSENVYNPDPSIQRIGYAPFHNGTNTDGTTDTISAYVFDTLELNSQWQINGGVRVDHYSTDFSKSTLGVNDPDLSKSGNLLNWKLGILYKPTENSSLYAAYATSQQPPGGSNFQLAAEGAATGAGTAVNDVAFDPQRTRTAEVGGKWDVIDGQLALTGALYRTVISNEVEGDATNGFFQTGRKRVQGIEVAAVGNITRAWSVSAGYTTMNTKVDGTSVTADGSQVFSFTPKQAFTAWTTYILPHGFTISGGARYVGKLNKPSDGATLVPKTVEGYWVYDAAATYTISKNVDLQLNLYNLTDKDYVASINKSGYRYFPGIERSARLTLNMKF
jgi:catecholate siderophore receptor